jgi:hypothetical protein
MLRQFRKIAYDSYLATQFFRQRFGMAEELLEQGIMRRGRLGQWVFMEV